MQGGGGEVGGADGVRAADGQDLVAQAVAVFQQEEVLGGQSGHRDGVAQGQRVAFGDGGQEFVAPDGQGFGAGAGAGFGQEQDVELAGGELVQKALGLVFAEKKLQGRVVGAQLRHQPGQQEGADGGD